MKLGMGSWKLIAIATFFTLMQTACIKEEFSLYKLDTTTDISPALAAPVGYFDFRLDKVIKTSDNAIIYINADRIVSLKYFGEVSSDKAGNLFRFDPVAEDLILENPTGGVIDLFSRSYQTSFNFKVPLLLSNSGGNAELDSIIFSSAHIRISDPYFSSANGEITVSIPGLSSGNQAFQTVITPISGELIFDISNYHLKLLNLPDKKNLIDIMVHVFFPRQENILYATLPYAQFSFEIVPQEWETIYGYLGQESIEFEQASFNTNFDRNFPDGEFYFAEPLLKFKTINSFGVPMGMGFSPISAETRDTGMIELTGMGVPVPPDYFYPAYPGIDSKIPEVQDSLMIDHQNSNLRYITSAEPERIHYQAVFLTNPGEQRHPNRIHSNSYFYTHVDLELPFHGKARGLAIRDTLGMDLSELDIPLSEDVQKIVFKLYYENSFPADIRLQLYLANEYLEITDTLFESFSEIKGTKPTDRFMENPVFVSGEIETSLPGNKINDIKNSRFLIGEARLTTVEERNDVKIFDNQHLFMNLGVILDINTTIDDF